MITKEIDLYQYFNVNRNKNVGGFLTAYLPSVDGDIRQKARPAMLVIPGGAYKICSDREGEPVALAYRNAGFCSFVLQYSVNTAYPIPLLEACMSVAYIRENADKYRADKNKVAAVGFSAGGHLAAMLGTVCKEEIRELTGKDYCRPDALILAYPVATLGEFTHEETCNVITGGLSELRLKLSSEKRVAKDSAPAFIWHTATDNAVPVENSLLLAAAYKRAGVPFALHIFEKGWHGLSLCTSEVLDEKDAEEFSSVSKWFSLSLDWLKTFGL